MLTLPAHACFFLLPERHKGRPGWSGASFARALGATFLVLGEARGGTRADAIESLERRLADDLAHGHEVAIATRGLRNEEVGHLKNLAKRAYFTTIDLSPEHYSPPGKEGLAITRVFPGTWRPWLHGPFDVIGDVHDCADELTALMDELGYRVERKEGSNGLEVTVYPHPEGRRLVFVGDFTDRGPYPVATVRTVLAAARSGALAVMGNHDKKLLDYLEGRHVSDKDWFLETARAVSALSDEERHSLVRFLAGLPSHLVLDDERLVVAHAGCRAEMQGRDNEHVTEFCMYGEGSGRLDGDGYPIRLDWAATYRGSATVVYGHVTTPVARWNEGETAICIDTGCCLGGALTALRWPERTLVCVRARRAYTELAGFLPRARGGERPGALLAGHALSHDA